MFKPRPCGCKGERTCLICEKEYGAWSKLGSTPTEEIKKTAYVYCPLCDLVWPGWTGNSWESHPEHEGSSLRIPGIKLLLNFITEEEELQLLENLDKVPWDLSQSGRLKQNYGPKCNFKKKKVKLDGFIGYPSFTKFIQERFKTVDLLQNFHTVEQCSLEYVPERGSSIDPHIDDCWIWGERIPTLSLLSDSVLTLNKYHGPLTKYNLVNAFYYPLVVKEDGSPKESSEIKMEFDALEKKSCKISGKEQACLFESLDFISSSDLIRIPMPRRSLLILYGMSRYICEHRIFREDIPSRRVCLTYRELTPTYLEHGPEAELGLSVLKCAENFWQT